MTQIDYGKVDVRSSNPELNGGWDITSSSIGSCRATLKSFVKGKKLDLHEKMTGAELVKHTDRRTVSGTASSAIVGAALAGPVGALVGAAAGGDRDKETLIKCTFFDGSEAVISCNDRQAADILGATTNKPTKGGLTIPLSTEEEQRYTDAYTDESFTKLITFIAGVIGGVCAIIWDPITGFKVGLGIAVVLWLAYKTLEWLANRQGGGSFSFKNQVPRRLRSKAVNVEDLGRCISASKPKFYGEFYYENPSLNGLTHASRTLSPILNRCFIKI